MSLYHLYACFQRIVERFAVGRERDVAVMESDLASFAAVNHTHAGVGHRHIPLSRGINQPGIDKDSEEEIEKHARNHHEQPLPCRLGTEFPVFRRLLHLLGIHGFVDHARDLAITA